MAGKFPALTWAANTNIYEVNLRQYTPEGTLAAFEAHLPRLKNMGVDVLWFMPLTPISELHRQGTLGSYYACSDYMAIHPGYGTTADFKLLVNHAHQLGMKVLIDIVANHTGCDHIWTQQHPEYYKLNAAGEFFDSHGWVDVYDLDYTNNDVHHAMIDVMKYWVNTYDVDGFRCDMAHLVPLEFWEKARIALDELKPLFWLAETEEAAYHRVFDCTFTWRFLHLAEDIYKGNSTTQHIVKLDDQYADEFPEHALRMFFLTNHDENSHSGSEYERLGNSARAFAVLCATNINSIPLLYSGQEIPVKKRLRFFDKDSIDWTQQCLMEDFYSTLLFLRKRNTALWAGMPENQMVLVETTDKSGHILAYVRTNHRDSVLVMLNLSNHSMMKFSLADLVETGRYKSIWSGLELEIDGETMFELEAWEYLVYEKINEV